MRELQLDEYNAGMVTDTVFGWTMWLLCTAAAAQVQVSASGTLTVRLQPSSGSVITHTLPVTGPASLIVSQVGSVVLTTGLESEMTMRALSPPFTCYGCWSASSGDVLLEYSAAWPTAGILRLETVPACVMGMPPFIDVDNDGTLEIVGIYASQTVDVPVVLGLDPLPIFMHGETVNFGGASCTSTTTVTFIPQAANLTSINRSCGPTVGGSLTGDWGARQLTVRVGGMNGLIGALIAGEAPIAQTTCALATIPTASAILVPSASGAELTIPISSALLGTFTLQYVELSPGYQLVFSNALVAVLP